MLIMIGLYFLLEEELKETGCEGAILGKAIYENKIELKSLMNFIEKQC